jgi:lipoyl(octanoyl) transferase
LKTVQLKDFGVTEGVAVIGERLLAHLDRLLPPQLPVQPPGAAGNPD